MGENIIYSISLCL